MPIHDFKDIENLPDYAPPLGIDYMNIYPKGQEPDVGEQTKNPEIKTNVRDGFNIDIDSLPDKVPPGSNDPAPFDIDYHINEESKTMPIEESGNFGDAISNTLHWFTRPFLAEGYETVAGLNRGMASLSAHLDAVGDYIGLMLGQNKDTGKGGIFKKAAELFESDAAYWKKRAEKVGTGFFEELIGEAVGGLVPGVAQFSLDVASGLTFPFMAGYTQSKEDHFMNGVLEAAKTGTLAKLFKITAPLKQYLRAPTQGTIFGLQEMEGAEKGKKTKAFAKGFLTGAGYSLTSPGGQMGLNEIGENIKPILEKQRKAIKDYKDSNNKGSILLPSKENIDSVYQQAINRFKEIEKLDKQAEKAGKKLEPGESPKFRSRSYLGISEKADSILKDKTYKINKKGEIEITGEGLEPILKDYEAASPEQNVKTRDQEFNDYFISVRTIEDLQRAKGDYTTKKIASDKQILAAHKKLAKLEQKYGNLDHFENVAERLYSFQDRVLHMLVDSGHMTEAKYKQILNLNPNYVPFDRVLEGMEEGGSTPKSKKPFDEARSPVKKIKGSEKEIEDVVGSIIKHTYKIVDVADRNTVVRSIANLQDVLPGIKPVRIKMVPIKVGAEEINTVTLIFMSEVQKIKQDIKTSSSQTGGNSNTSGPLKKLEMVVVDALKSRGMTEGEANAYLHKIKGQTSSSTVTTETIEKTIDRIVEKTTETLEIPQDSTIFRPSQFKPTGNIIEYYENGSRKYIEVSKNLYDAMKGMDNISSTMLVKILSAPAHLLRVGTTTTPEFVLRNSLRDQFDAFIQTHVGFRPGIDTIGALSDIMQRNDVYYDWLRSGGAHSTFVDLGRSNLNKIATSLKRDPNIFKYLNVVNDIRAISLAVEQATKLGVYKASIRSGKSPVEAGFISPESTVDFRVRGRSQTLKKFGEMTAFFNPAIQGTDRFIRAHKENPLSVATKAVASVTVPSVLLWFLNKDDEGYQELPQWQKDLFWVVRVGEDTDRLTWVRIPKPFLYGQVYGSAVERFLDFTNGKDTKIIDDFIGPFIAASTPVQGDPAGAILPTFAKPIIENAADWSFFGERPIVSKATKDLEPYLQYGKYTTETAKIIGSYLNWSPSKIENFVQGYTGSLGHYGLESMDLILDVLQTEENKKGKRPRELSDMPGIKAFVPRSPESSPQSLTDFYKYYDEITKAYNSYRNRMEANDFKDAERLFEKYPAMIMYQNAKDVAGALSELNNQINYIAESNMEDDNKREYIRMLENMRLMTLKQEKTMRIDELQNQ